MWLNSAKMAEISRPSTYNFSSTSVFKLSSDGGQRFQSKRQQRRPQSAEGFRSEQSLQGVWNQRGSNMRYLRYFALLSVLMLPLVHSQAHSAPPSPADPSN